MNPLGETDFRVGGWLIAPKLNSLSSDGKTVRLEPKVMQVLICLAEAGDVVPKEKLMNRVWAGTFVTDDVLTRSISELRKAFEDDPKNPRFIQTIPKGGYRSWFGRKLWLQVMAQEWRRRFRPSSIP